MLWFHRSAELFGESDENASGATEVTEPIGVFIVDDFGHELRAALAEPLEAELAKEINRRCEIIDDDSYVVIRLGAICSQKLCQSFECAAITYADRWLERRAPGCGDRYVQASGRLEGQRGAGCF